MYKNANDAMKERATIAQLAALLDSTAAAGRAVYGFICAFPAVDPGRL